MITIDPCDSKSRYGVILSKGETERCHRNYFKKDCANEIKEIYGLVDETAIQYCVDKKFGKLSNGHFTFFSIATVLFAIVLLFVTFKRQAIPRRRENTAYQDEFSFRVFV